MDDGGLPGSDNYSFRRQPLLRLASRGGERVTTEGHQRTAKFVFARSQGIVSPCKVRLGIDTGRIRDRHSRHNRLSYRKSGIRSPTPSHRRRSTMHLGGTDDSRWQIRPKGKVEGSPVQPASLPGTARKLGVHGDTTESTCLREGELYGSLPRTPKRNHRCHVSSA